MSNWEKKHKEMHRLIARRSHILSIACVLSVALSVVFIMKMKEIVDDYEKHKVQVLLRQELLKRQK